MQPQDLVDHGSNQTRTAWVICPWIRKFAIFYFVYTLASANINQSVPILATIYMPIRSRMSSIMRQIEEEHLELFALEFGKTAESDFVYALAFINFNQSAPDLVRNHVTIRSRMSSVMEINGPELSQLSALELENLPFLTLFTLASPNIDQSVPNLATIYMPIRSQMSSILGQIEAEHSELFALEFEKIAESDFVYTPASTNINQSAPN